MPCGAISSIVMRLPFTDLELSKEKIMREGGKLYIGKGTISGRGAKCLSCRGNTYSKIMVAFLQKKDYLMPFRPYNILFFFFPKHFEFLRVFLW